MRLTLRTLLAYLDDTLEPSEIKQIGQKVAESDAARELIARIKQVTRRRRLTTPPDGGSGERFDANRVAAYLDNELTPEEIAEIEKVCLESDVHLAEAAAAHQILTLVLGEPALVPPPARRRMYALEHGRPVKAAAKPAPAAAPAGAATPGEDGEPDDTLMGLPLFRQWPWLRWALPLASVVLLAVLAVFLFNNLAGPAGNPSARRDPDKPADSTPPTDKPADPNKDQSPTPEPPKPADNAQPKDKPADDPRPDDSGKPMPKPPVPTPPPDMDPPRRPQPPPPGKPSAERLRAGAYDTKGQVLVRRDADTWRRFGLGDEVLTSEPLVSLPGYKSEVRLDSEVNLLLWGNLPELFPMNILESAVTLHHTDTAALDADLTLHRGRIYITNRKAKGPAVVRLRFWREEVWDITLEEPDTTVGVQLATAFVPNLKGRDGEEPLVQVELYVLRGEISLKADRRTFGALRGPVGRALVSWNNKGPGLGAGPQGVSGALPEWNRDQPLPTDPKIKAVAGQLAIALEELAGELTRPEKRVEIALREYMEDKNPYKRALGVRCVAAIDDVARLVSVLSDDAAIPIDVRQESLIALLRWLSRGSEQAALLYDRDRKTGLLLDKRFTPEEAENALSLFYDFTPEERLQRTTYAFLIGQLKSERVLIRDLAFRHLVALVPGANIDYDPTGTPEQRDRGYQAWRQLLDQGKLPPPPP